MEIMQEVFHRERRSLAGAPQGTKARLTVALAVASLLAIIAAPSLVGPFDPRISARIVPAVMVGAIVTWYGPRAAILLPWRGLLVVALVASMAWALALAVSDGFDAVSAP